VTKTFCDMCGREIQSSDNSIELDAKIHNCNRTSFIKEPFSMIMCANCWFAFKKYLEGEI